MKKWNVACAVSGQAWCQVEAATYDEAIKAAKESEDWELEDWDRNWSNFGGSIYASEVK